MTHLTKQKLQAMMNSKNDINFLYLNIVTALKLIFLFFTRDAVDINQQLMNTYNVYHEQIFIHNDNEKIYEHCKLFISINIESNIIFEVIWLIQRDSVISYFQWILIWRKNMRSSTKLKNSDELNLKTLMKELESEDSSQIYQICIENAENQDDTVQVEISKSYCDLAEVFSESKTNSLFLHCKQNHVIDLINEWISSFNFIYNSSEKKLTKFWKYLNENLENDFIWFSQFSAKTSMLFAFKPDDKLQLCVNYCELNAVITKNHYSLFLIEKIMNCVNKIKIFTKINIKNVYYWIWIHKDDK